MKIIPILLFMLSLDTEAARPSEHRPPREKPRANVAVLFENDRAVCQVDLGAAPGLALRWLQAEPAQSLYSGVPSCNADRLAQLQDVSESTDGRVAAFPFLAAPAVACAVIATVSVGITATQFSGYLSKWSGMAAVMGTVLIGERFMPVKWPYAMAAACFVGGYAMVVGYYHLTGQDPWTSQPLPPTPYP